MKLLIVTPYYEVKGYAPYIKAIQESRAFLKAAGVETVYEDRCGDSYVDRAKNAMLALFKHKHTDCSHMLMIDSDMRWDMEGLANIVKAPVDLVGGTYPMKNDWEKYCSNALMRSLPEDPTMGIPARDESTGLIEALFVPGGFLKLSRRCVDLMWSAYEILTYQDPAGYETVWLFQPILANGQYQTEDVTFCQRWRGLGEKVWIEPRITFGHTGVKEWVGNYHEYLLKLPGGLNDPAKKPETEEPEQ